MGSDEGKLCAATPDNRIAAGVEAGDYGDFAVCHPEEQAVGKSPQPGATHIPKAHRKLLWIGRDPVNLEIQFLSEP